MRMVPDTFGFVPIHDLPENNFFLCTKKDNPEHHDVEIVRELLKISLL